ncbi:MAG: enoyl-CoA hydratase, partial [Bradyrhizobium sp.]
YAQRLADNAPLVLSMLKQFVADVVPGGPMERVSYAMREVERVMSSTDFREGLRSREEKRRPRFLGK